MVSIYEKNLNALKMKYPLLANKIVEDLGDYENDMIPIVEEAKDKTKILKIKKRNKEWLLNSKYYPGKSAETWIKQFSKIEYMASIVMFGLGNGIYLKKLLKETEDTVNILIYEPSRKIFDTVIKNIDISELFVDRVYIVVKNLNDEEFILAHDAYINYSNLSISKHVFYPNYDKIFTEELASFYKEIKNKVGRITMDRNTELLFSKSITLNSLKNMKYNITKSTVKQLCGRIPNDTPAIIVAAGPSLNKNIMELKNAKNKAFIVATDTAVKPMLNAGIIPDIYVTIDAEKPLVLFDDKRILDIPVCVTEMSNSKILDMHKGKMFFASAGNKYIENIFKKYNKEYEGLETGGSVANNAFSLVEELGITTIILVGQDLAYTNNKSHADGTFEEKINETKEYNQAKYTEVEDIYGNKVKTLVNLKYYKEWFEKKIVQNKSLRVIDATEGGAKIKGTEVISLKEAIERECKEEINYQSILSEVPKAFDFTEIKDVVKYIEKTPGILEEIKKKATKGIKDYKKLKDFFVKKKFDSKEFQKVNKRIKILTKYLEEIPEMYLILPYIKLVDYQISNDIFKVEENISEEGKIIADKGILMLQAIKQGIEELEPEIKLMVEGVKGEVDNVK